MRLADRIRSRGPDVRYGALRGFIAGAFFAISAVAEDHNGSLNTPGDALHATLIGWVLWLVLGGTVAGAIAGLLRPLATRWFGAALVGVAAAAPMALAADG